MTNRPIRVKDVRCNHRHTFDEHPNCFAEGNVNVTIRTDREWERVTRTPWWTFPEHNFCYVDIETDGFKPDFSTMLCWAVKAKDGDTKYSVIKKKELFTTINVDKRLTQNLVDELRNHKIWVSYYGTGFDLPYIRAKALHYGIDFPEFGTYYHHDMYYTVRNKFHLSRNSLDNACDYFGIEGKTPISKEAWRRAKYGNEEAMGLVLEHNVADVEILELLHGKMVPWRKWIRTSI
jgi:uncharacterized protein YprB with RNaseH-like and TPR domain